MTYIHYITLDSITSNPVGLNYITLNYIRLHQTKWHQMALAQTISDQFFWKHESRSGRRNQWM